MGKNDPPAGFWEKCPGQNIAGFICKGGRREFLFG